MTEPNAIKSSAVERASERFYAGLWGVLVRWMRVPTQPPNLPVPEGEEVLAIHPSIGFLRYMKFWFWIVLAIVDIGLLVGWIIVTVINPIVGAITAPLWLALIVVPDVIAYLAIHLRYDTTWFVISQRSIRIRRGVWVIREMTFTFENVQNVRVSQGPVERHFNIAKVHVETAGSGSSSGAHGEKDDANVGIIEGIDNAQELRDLIMDRVRASRTTGLGDERLEHAGQHAPGEMWTEAHVEALRDIRDLACAQ